MAIQLSVALRNAKADQFEAEVGASGTLEIRTGAQPADCASANSGTVLSTISLPADFMNAAANGVVAINNGPWTDASADATGTAGHFRIFNGATCHMQGSAGTSGTDMILTSADLTAGEPFEITLFTVTEGNA